MDRHAKPPANVEKLAAVSPFRAPDGAENPTVYAGRYELVGLLGVGGMGSVYRVHDLLLDVTIALKLLRKDFATNPASVQRFYREVRLARRITHRNVVRIYDVEEYLGEYFLTMECIEGDSLGTMLNPGKPLEIDHALEIGRQVALGIDASHAEGVIHCDLKPENILLGKDERVVLTDFGVAIAEGEARPVLPGSAGGTPIYMAPEQIEGRAVDQRTDVFALGILLYEMLTGSPPWSLDRGSAAASVARLSVPASDPRQRNAEIPADVAVFVLRMLAREAAQRPGTAISVAKTLAASLDARRSGDKRAATSVRLPPSSSPMEPAQILTTNTPHARGVAVLSFRNLGDSSSAYLAEAMTDEIVQHLAKAPGLRVASRASLRADEVPGEALRTLGKRLGVHAIVEGTIQARSDGTMHIGVRLVEVDRGFALFSTQIERKAHEVFSVSRELATDVARALTVDLGGMRGRAPAAPGVVDRFLRARREYATHTLAGVSEAYRLIKSLGASQRNPLVASWMALARLRWWGFAPELGSTASDEVETLARSLIAEDPTLGEAHLALAVLHDLVGRSSLATKAATEAVRCNPTLGEAHLLLGILYAETGNVEEGIRRLKLSLRLDPRNFLSLLELARTAELTGDADGADAWLTLAEQRAPGHVQPALLRVRIASWRGAKKGLADARQQAIAVAKKALPAEADALHLFALDESEVRVGRLMVSAALPGASARYRWTLMQLVAEERAIKKDFHGALSAVRSAQSAGFVDVLWLEKCAAFDKLRIDPAFEAVRRTISQRARATFAGPDA